MPFMQAQPSRVEFNNSCRQFARFFFCSSQSNEIKSTLAEHMHSCGAVRFAAYAPEQINYFVYSTANAYRTRTPATRGFHRRMCARASIECDGDAMMACVFGHVHCVCSANGRTTHSHWVNIEYFPGRTHMHVGQQQLCLVRSCPRNARQRKPSA